MAQLTVEMVAAIAPYARANGLDAEWDYLIQTCRKYEITTKNRVAAFLANLFKESGELYYVEEIADGWDYEWREDLGNRYAGDGPRYKGHGYIQITGRNNHRAVGQALGIDAVSDPLILTRMPYPWLSAGWYWTHGSSWGNLNDYADAGDFGSTVWGVRGGPDADRWRYWYAALDILPDDLDLSEEEGGEVAEYPTVWVIKNESGWAVDPETGKYIRARERPNAAFAADPEGWMYPESPNKRVVGPAPKSSGSFVDMHPTNFTWRRDLADLVRSIEAQYNIYANTYYDHPPGWGRDMTSVDFWGPPGRGSPIDSGVGNAIVDRILGDPNPPYVDWLIFEGWIYAEGQWQPFQDDGTGLHYDHVHVTVQ